MTLRAWRVDRVYRELDLVFSGFVRFDVEAARTEFDEAFDEAKAGDSVRLLVGVYDGRLTVAWTVMREAWVGRTT